MPSGQANWVDLPQHYVVVWQNCCCLMDVHPFWFLSEGSHWPIEKAFLKKASDNLCNCNLMKKRWFAFGISCVCMYSIGLLPRSIRPNDFQHRLWKVPFKRWTRNKSVAKRCFQTPSKIWHRIWMTGAGRHIQEKAEGIFRTCMKLWNSLGCDWRSPAAIYIALKGLNSWSQLHSPNAFDDFMDLYVGLTWRYWLHSWNVWIFGGV